MRFAWIAALLMIVGRPAPAQVTTVDEAGDTTITETVYADAATDTPEAADSTAPVACFPDCRTGYFCHEGTCISRCNPPCDAGTACTDEGECVAQPTASSATQPAPPHPPPPAQVETQTDTQAALRQAEEEARWRKAQARAQRLEYLSAMRITLNLGWSWMFDGLYRSTFQGTVGIARNFAPFFGLHGHVGGLVGYGADDVFGASEKVLTGGVYADVIPFFGPFGRFVIGPLGWFSSYWAARDRIEDGDSYGDDLSTGGGPTGGAGLDMGVLLGEKLNYGFHWRFRTTFDDDRDAYFELNFTYHFLK